MKIVHLVWSFNFGGIQTMVVDLMNEQVKEHEIHLIIINDNIAPSLTDKINGNVKIHMIRRKLGSKNLMKILKMNVILYFINPDIVHCHFHNQIRMLHTISKKKILCTVHDVNWPVKYLKYYSKLFSISESVKEDIGKRGNMESVVIHNGLKLSDIEVKTDYDFHMFRIVMISRLMHTKKGQDILIRAMQLLVYEHNYKNVELHIIGEGESEQYLKELTNNLDLNEYVRFTGFKDRDFLNHHLQDFDLLVQPSRYEGFGITIIEGMAAGLPVLVSNIDGPLEIIRNGEYGYSFQAEDIKDCANRIIEIYNIIKSGNYQKNRDKILKYVIENFSIESAAVKYLQNY